MASDDPWDWTIDRVIQELCTSNRSWTPRSASAPVPDPTILSEALRAQGISGDILLTDVDDSVMRDDLNIKVLSWRIFIRHAITHLRKRSAQYKVYMQDQPATKATHSTEEIISRGIQGGIQGFIESQARSAQGLASGIAPIRFGHSEPLAAVDYGNVDEPSSKRLKLSIADANGNIAAPVDDGQPSLDAADSGIVTPGPETSAPLSLTGQKRKRIAPTLITTEIDPNRNREIYTAADDLINRRSTELAQPKPTAPEPGAIFIDRDGRKRIIPILQSQPMSSQSQLIPGELQTSRPSSKQAVRSGAAGAAQGGAQPKPKNSKLGVGYLGRKAMSVDQIFYEGVVTGEDIEVSELSENLTNFCQSPREISSGQRQYVGNMMKRYLRSEVKIFSRGEESFLAVQPYSDKLIPQFQQASFTLYCQRGDKTYARREDVSKWPEVNLVAKSQQLIGNEHLATFHPLGPGIIGNNSYGDWDFSSLDKYRYLEGGDEILPLYGDSDSDNEYDLDTWNEMEEEMKKKLERPLGNLRRPQLTSDEVNEAIDAGIAQMIARWTEKALPKLEKKAWNLWMKARKTKTKRERIFAAKLDLKHIEERLVKLRDKILLGVYTTVLQVLKQAASMDRTVFVQQELKWKILILKQNEIPEKPERSDPVTKPKVSRPLLANDHGLEGESLESDIEASSFEDSLDDFIVDEDAEGDTLMGEGDIPMGEGESDTSTDSEDDDLSMTDQQSTRASPLPVRRAKDLSTPSKADQKRRASSQTVSLDDRAAGLSIKKERASTAQHSSSSILVRASTVVIDLTLTSSDEGTPLPKDKAIRPEADTIDLVTPASKLNLNRYRYKVNPGLVDSDDDYPEGQETPTRKTGGNKSLKDPAGTESNESDADSESDDDSESDESSDISVNEDEVPEGGTSRKKKKKKFVEDVEARYARERDQKRLREQEARRKKLHATLASQGEHEENDGVIVNDAATEGHFYLNDFITKRIKKHQIEGLRFLWTSAIKENKDLGGCLLAHTMGLGKTMQAISLLVSIAEAAAHENPLVSSQVPERLRESKTLILCPPGLIDNWMDELLFWVNPENLLGNLFKIDAAMWLPDRLQTISRWHKEGGILILGYEMFRNFVMNKRTGKREPQLSEEEHARVINELIKGPNIVVADEAHKMKDAKIDLTKAAMQIDTKCRIALTGSPLANNLEEYHTMIDWVSPNYLGPAREFRAKFVDPIEAGLYWDSEPIEKRKALKMLQVLKINIDPKVHRADMLVMKNDLPPKREFTITVALTEVQKKAYKLFVRSMMTGSGVMDLTKDGDVKQATLWNWLAILTLLCNHPSCFKEKLTERREEARKALLKAASSKDVTDTESSPHPLADIDSPGWNAGVPKDLIDRETELFDGIPDIEAIKLSNKVKILCQILDLSKKAKDKVLVFSQSIPTLNFIEGLCKRQERNYCRLDGKTKMNTRQAQTKAFNDENDLTDVFLISTTAGGLGLNLPGANRVVIFDFKFNPIQEEQAIGRAYRIGQRKETFVYRFIVGGTFESIVHNKTIFKSQLSSRVVDKKSVMPMAKRKAKDFLFDPKDVVQEDLSAFEGMDNFVLDRILESQSEESTIRAIVQADTFEQDDNDKLTAEEEMECVAIQKQGMLSGMPINWEALHHQSPVINSVPNGPERVIPPHPQIMSVPNSPEKVILPPQTQIKSVPNGPEKVIARPQTKITVPDGYKQVILPPRPSRTFFAPTDAEDLANTFTIYQPPPPAPSKAPQVSEGIQVSGTHAAAGVSRKDARSMLAQSPASTSHRPINSSRSEISVLIPQKSQGSGNNIIPATNGPMAHERGLLSRTIPGQSRNSSVASSAAVSGSSPNSKPIQTPDSSRGHARRSDNQMDGETPDEQAAIQNTDMYKAMSRKPATVVTSLKTPVTKNAHRRSHHRRVSSRDSSGISNQDRGSLDSRSQEASPAQPSRSSTKGAIMPKWAREGIEHHRKMNANSRSVESEARSRKSNDKSSDKSNDKSSDKSNDKSSDKSNDTPRR